MGVGSQRARRRRRRQGGPQFNNPGQGGGYGPNGQGGRPPMNNAGFSLGLSAPPPMQPKAFEDLTSIDPQPRLTLEYPGCPASCRLIDLFCPIGRGQRGLIVSPPKAGKTTLLKDMGTAILRNHPDVELILLLVDERPEEVTDFRRTFAQVEADLRALPMGITPTAGNEGRDPVAEAQALAAAQNGVAVGHGPGAARGPVTGGSPVAARSRVLASSNDHEVDRHIEVSTQAISYAKSLVQAGRHVVVLLDSLTRVGRAFNRSRRHASSGRTLTGGIDSRALEVPKQIFGSARNTEEAGSLTIIASCLVDTGSQGDQVIFEEFKGTGNMELILDRKISERRLFPAINLAASGTRKEHLLLTEQELKTMTALRRRLMNMPPHMQVEQLLAAIQRFPTNAALVGGPS
ncbi:MAG: transcription termination factor Rho [Phycisphaerales bacterium]